MLYNGWILLIVFDVHDVMMSDDARVWRCLTSDRTLLLGLVLGDSVVWVFFGSFRILQFCPILLVAPPPTACFGCCLTLKPCSPFCQGSRLKQLGRSFCSFCMFLLDDCKLWERFQLQPVSFSMWSLKLGCVLTGKSRHILPYEGWVTCTFCCVHLIFWLILCLVPVCKGTFCTISTTIANCTLFARASI